MSGVHDASSAAGTGIDQASLIETHLYWYADTFKKSDVLSIQQSIVNHVEYTIARSRYKFDDQEAYQAASFSLRDRLIESWNDTQQYFK